MQTLTAPEVGQVFISAAQDMAVLIEAVDAGIITATATEFRPKQDGGVDIVKRPIRMSADEWADLSRIHELSPQS